MRKISQKAAQAFLHCKNFSLDNTTVSVIRHGNHQGTEIEMRLHGNKIAYRNLTVDGISKVHVSLAGWGTPTTRERVNGLLTTLGAVSNGGYYQKNHCQMFSCLRGKNGRFDFEVDARDWIEVETRC